MEKTMKKIENSQEILNNWCFLSDLLPQFSPTTHGTAVAVDGTCGAWGFLDFFAETERRGRAHLEPTGVSRAAEQVFFYTVSIR